MNWDAIEGTPLETAINTFQEQTGIEVEVQAVPSGDEYETKMRTLLASGSPPDIMRINDDYVRGYSLGGQLLDLNPFIQASGLDPASYNEHPFNFPIQPDGQHAAWTIATQPAVIFYNVNQFEEAGVALPPGTWTGENWTWDNFLETAQALTIEDERWGALLYKDTSCETIYTVNNGEPTGIYSEDGTQFTLANPAAIAGMQWVADLTCVHGVQPRGEPVPGQRPEPALRLRQGLDAQLHLRLRRLRQSERQGLRLGYRPTTCRTGGPNHDRDPDRFLHSQGRRESRGGLATPELPRWP